MTLRCTKQSHIFQAITLLCLICLWNCSRVKKKEYAYNPAGYYYKLIAFSSDTFTYRPGYMAQVAATFNTQHDSVFWDSATNLNDNFFIETDSAGTAGFLQYYISGCATGDSACLLIPASAFFKQQFKSAQLPFFSKHDSVVKVRVKVKQVLSPAQYTTLKNTAYKKEQQQIDAFIALNGNTAITQDALGFYWLGEPAGQAGGTALKPGTTISLSYKGTFLNGRFLEASPPGFEITWGTPDQLLKGLNYVIGRLKIGQNAKIILPSRLAFGENGSTNGSVPPFTPLLYEIKLTDVKEP